MRSDVKREWKSDNIPDANFGSNGVDGGGHVGTAGKSVESTLAVEDECVVAEASARRAQLTPFGAGTTDAAVDGAGVVCDDA